MCECTKWRGGRRGGADKVTVSNGMEVDKVTNEVVDEVVDEVANKVVDGFLPHLTHRCLMCTKWHGGRQGD